MANPQPENYTKVSNELLEALCRIRIPGEAVQVLYYIIRRTYGFGKKKDAISLSQFSKGTGLSRQNSSRAIKKLVKKNIIKVSKEGYITEYEIQKDYEKWINEEEKEKAESVVKNECSQEEKTEEVVYSKLTTEGTQNGLQKVLKTDYKTVVQNDYNKRKKEIFKETLKKKRTADKKRPPRNKSSGPDFIDQIIQIFKEEYFKVKGFEYRSNGVDRKAAGQLLKEYKRDNKDSQETLNDFRDFFKKCLSINDKWYYEHMTIPLINSKLNEIRSIIYETHQRYDRAISEAELQEFFKSIDNDPRFK
jgi:phage replication O-like protein O